MNSRGKMMRFTIDDYCKQFNIPKETVALQLKTDKLNYIIEDGTTYIIVTRSSLNRDTRREIHEQNRAVPQVSNQTTVGVILSLYKQENRLLKDKIQELESKIDSLIHDKEQMLKDERDRIENLYNTKDEQLKKILELINTKLMIEHEQHNTTDEIINVAVNTSSPLVELKRYLKSMDIDLDQKKRIKKRFFAAKDQDIRIIEHNGKLYLDFAKYDYTDLLRH